MKRLQLSFVKVLWPLNPPVELVRVTAFMVMAAATLAAIPVAAAEPLTGRVVNVHDGDTVRVLDAANVQHKVRLQGIDAPELGQPFGAVARDRLAAVGEGADRGRDRQQAGQVRPHARPPGDWRARREPTDGRCGAGVALHAVRSRPAARCRRAGREGRQAWPMG